MVDLLSLASVAATGGVVACSLVFVMMLKKFLRAPPA